MTRYWYHDAVAREIVRLRDLGELPYPAKGIAGNIGFAETDVIKYARDDGFDVNAPARWDWPGAWIGLPNEGVTV